MKCKQMINNVYISLSFYLSVYYEEIVLVTPKKNLESQVHFVLFLFVCFLFVCFFLFLLFRPSSVSESTNLLVFWKMKTGKDFF